MPVLKPVHNRTYHACVLYVQSKKKRAKASSAHKTKYYAKPAYQAKPKIEEIPLQSFLKTAPLFNKKKKAIVGTGVGAAPKTVTGVYKKGDRDTLG